MSFIKYFSAPCGVVSREEYKKYRVAGMIMDILAWVVALAVLAGVTFMFIYGLILGWL